MIKWTAPLLTIALMVSMIATRASAEDKVEQKKAETGTVVGVVTDPEGKPAAGVSVRLFNHISKADRKAAKAQASKGDKADKADKPAPVATGQTDSDGKFTLKDVPVGHYMIGAKQRGFAAAKEEIEVKSGGETKVELKLAAKRVDSPKKAE